MSLYTVAASQWCVLILQCETLLQNVCLLLLRSTMPVTSPCCAPSPAGAVNGGPVGRLSVWITWLSGATKGGAIFTSCRPSKHSHRFQVNLDAPIFWKYYQIENFDLRFSADYRMFTNVSRKFTNIYTRSTTANGILTTINSVQCC